MFSSFGQNFNQNPGKIEYYVKLKLVNFIKLSILDEGYNYCPSFFQQLC